MLTLVCGLGRCGTTMMMHMLRAGGVSVVGLAPGFEDDRAANVPIDAAWLVSLGDSAVKVLDPHRGWREQVAARAIWLDRDETEQAKSQVKFLRLVGGVPIPTSAWKAMRSRLRADRALCMRVIPVERKIISFEAVLASPCAAASELATWFDGFDQDAAAAVVKRRSPKCATSLQLETELMMSNC